MLENVIDGLFHIAKADGLVHENELDFLARIAEIFGIDEAHFRRIMARHVHLEGRDHDLMLGVSPSDEFSEIRKSDRSMASEPLPDQSGRASRWAGGGLAVSNRVAVVVLTIKYN